MNEKDKKIVDENYNRLQKIVGGEKIVDVFKNVPQEDIKDFVKRFDKEGYVDECIACAEHSLIAFRKENYGEADSDLAQSAWAEQIFRKQGKAILKAIKENPALLQNEPKREKLSLKARIEALPKYNLPQKEMEGVEKKSKELSFKLEQAGKNNPLLVKAYTNYLENTVLTEKNREQFYDEKTTYKKNENVLWSEITKIEKKADEYQRAYRTIEERMPKQNLKANEIPLWENVKALFYRKFEPSNLSLPDYKEDIKILSNEQKNEVREEIGRREHIDFSLFDMNKVTEKGKEVFQEIVAGMIYTDKVRKQYGEAFTKHKNSFLEKENQYYTKSDSLSQQKDDVYRTFKEEYAKTFGLKNNDFFITQSFAYVEGKENQMGNSNVVDFEKQLSKELPIQVRQELVNYEHKRVNKELDNHFSDWGSKVDVPAWKHLIPTGNLQTLLSSDYQNLFENENRGNRAFFEQELDKRILSDITNKNSPEQAGELVIGLIYDETSREEMANFLARNNLSAPFKDVHNHYVFNEKEFLTDHMYDEYGKIVHSKAEAENILEKQNNLFSEKCQTFIEVAKKVLKEKADINVELTNQVSFKR